MLSSFILAFKPSSSDLSLFYPSVFHALEAERLTDRTIRDIKFRRWSWIALTTLLLLAATFILLAIIGVANDNKLRSKLVTKITITLKEIPTYSHLSCDTCAGQITDVSTVAEGQTADGRRITICERCLLENDNDPGGQDGFDTVLRDEIEKLESQAKVLRGLVGRLEVPTYADWFRAEWERELHANFPRSRRIGPTGTSLFDRAEVACTVRPRDRETSRTREERASLTIG